MDDSVLRKMTEVYMTDSGVATAVRRYADIHGCTLEAAALKVAPQVVPAPHNVAAHDARYLLAPGTEQEDHNAWNLINPSPQNIHSFETEAMRGVECGRSLDDVVGPIPPHPDDDRDDRRRFTTLRWVSAQDYSCIQAVGRKCLNARHSCDEMCEIGDDLSNQMEAAQRLPVGPPVMSLNRVGEAWQLRLTVDTVPMRRRKALILVYFNSGTSNIETLVSELLEILEHSPDYRMVVRHNPVEPWVTVVVYAPESLLTEFDIYESGSPEETAAMLDSIFRGRLPSDHGIFANLAEIVAAENGQGG